jgi:mRNA interferase MazF
VERGEVWWADLGMPRGSAPALRRPVVIVQSDRFNASRIANAIVVAVISNLRLAAMPGNVSLPNVLSGLPYDSVANVSQVATVDRDDLVERVGSLPEALRHQIDEGLRLVLAL